MHIGPVLGPDPPDPPPHPPHESHESASERPSIRGPKETLMIDIYIYIHLYPRIETCRKPHIFLQNV